MKEAVEAGYARDESESAIVEAIRSLHDDGAEVVLLSRGGEPALAFDGSELLEVRFPGLSAVYPPGTGDSMFAALGVGIAAGLRLEDSLRIAGAAGALNAMRRGLGTGRREEIERLLPEVTVSRSSRISHTSASG